MSTYTTELRYVLEDLAGVSGGYDKVDEIIETARPLLFNFDYPTYDEAQKKRVETLILEYYYTREICAETVGRWKLFLKAHMKKVMPYFVDLYKSTAKEYDPVNNVSITRKGSNDNNGTTSSTDTVEGKSTNKYLDTPENSLDGIENNTYLTNATLDENNNTSSNSGSTTGHSEYEDTEEGYNGMTSVGKRLQEYREAIINIDQQVVDSCDSLFMCIW